MHGCGCCRFIASTTSSTAKSDNNGTAVDTKRGNDEGLRIVVMRCLLKMKCQYYNKGYCKHKDKFQYYHPTANCKNKCENQNNCMNRHQKLCRYGTKCYHNRDKECEFLHVTLATSDDQKAEANTVMQCAMPSQPCLLRLRK